VVRERDPAGLPKDLVLYLARHRPRGLIRPQCDIVKPGEGHFPVGPQDPTPAVDFVVAKTQ
jgi:hypothetical protein